MQNPMFFLSSNPERKNQRKRFPAQCRSKKEGRETGNAETRGQMPKKAILCALRTSAFLAVPLGRSHGTAAGSSSQDKTT